MNKVPEIFGSMVFNESVMKARLPKDTFKSLMRTRKAGTPLAPEGLGRRARLHAFYALVPADDRCYRRKA